MKKTAKYFLISLSFLATFFVITSQDASATIIKKEPVLITSEYYFPQEVYTITDDNGEQINFTNEQDYNDFLESTVTPYSGTTIKNEVLKTTSFAKKWIGYHSYTPNWSKASGYTLSSGKTYSASGSFAYEGMTVSLGYSQVSGATTSFTASSSKYSKLGVWADITVKKVKSTSYDNYTGAVVSTWYSNIVTYQNYYIQVVYQ